MLREAVWMLAFFQLATTTDYLSLLGYELPISGVPNTTVVDELYIEKIKPLFATNKLMTQSDVLREFVTYLEAKQCIMNMDCLEKVLSKEPITSDPFNQLWEGLHRLDAYLFRTQVLDIETNNWLLLFIKEEGSKEIDFIRNILLDVAHIVKSDVKIGVVPCEAGQYDICTVVGNTPAVILWNKKLPFQGKISVYELARFIITHEVDVTIKNYNVEEIIPTIVKSKKHLFLIDSTADTLQYPDLKTVIGLTSQFVDVGVFDCVKYYSLCSEGQDSLDNKTPFNGFLVEYTDWWDTASAEDMKTGSYGLLLRQCGSKPEQLVKVILTETSSPHDIIKVDAHQLHKLAIKAKHGRVSPFMVFMGPPEPTIRLHSLRREIAPIKLYHLDCSELELYCYRYHADTDVPKYLSYKKGGFEYLVTRDNVHDRAKALSQSLKSKLLSMRSEDLYSILQETGLNNTVIQYYNTTNYEVRANIEEDAGTLREAANVVYEVHGTAMFVVDCALYADICKANKVDQVGIHFISDKKVIKEHSPVASVSNYVDFIKHCNEKEVMVEEQMPAGSTGGSGDDAARREFEEFERNEL